MKKAQIKILFILHMGFFSCSLLSVEKTLENKTFVDYSCEDYAARSQDEKFALRYYAGLKALQLCKTVKPEYTFDISTIPNWQKRLFAAELPENKTDQMATAEMSTEDVKLKLKMEKDPKEKLSLYKNLRQKYRNSGKKAAAS